MDFNLSSGLFSAEQNFKPLKQDSVYDVLILGGGPAGLTAAVYCIRKAVTTGLIVRDAGGQVAETAGIENYMGYRYINGIELVQKFKEQVFQFGIDYDEGATIQSIETGDIKKVGLSDGRSFSARSLIIATGAAWRKLGVPGEERLRGKGVANCSTCDAPFFVNRKVIVVGGGNTGIESAIDLAKVAEKVVIIQMLDRLTGDDVLVNNLRKFENVQVMYECEVASIDGAVKVESVSVKNRKTGALQSITADGIFVNIGLMPNSGFARGLLEINQAGEIIVDSFCRTSAPGIFAAGDVTNVPFKQIIIAGGDGAKAALSACNYLLMDRLERVRGTRM